MLGQSARLSLYSSEALLSRAMGSSTNTRLLPDSNLSWNTSDDRLRSVSLCNSCSVFLPFLRSVHSQRHAL